MLDALKNLWENTGLFKFTDAAGNFDIEYLIKTLAMYIIIGVLVYLAVKKGFEPLLLLPIAFGMLLANIPGANIFHSNWFIDGIPKESLISLCDELQLNIETITRQELHKVLLENGATTVETFKAWNAEFGDAYFSTQLSTIISFLENFFIVSSIGMMKRDT